MFDVIRVVHRALIRFFRFREVSSLRGYKRNAGGKKEGKKNAENVTVFLERELTHSVKRL